MIDLNTLIGKPYVVGKEGPDEYDCWGLAKFIQKELFGRELPSIQESPSSLKGLMNFVKEHEVRKKWQVAKNYPIHGQLVELSKSENPFHIGVYLNIDGGGILHSIDKLGVCFDKIRIMKIMGWRKMVFHDFIG